MKSIVLSLTASMLLCSCGGSQSSGNAMLSERDTLCVHIVKVDTLVMRDTITIGPEKIEIHEVHDYTAPEIPILDSVSTQRVLEKSLETNAIELPEINGSYPRMYYRTDLEYLPYLIMTFSKPYPLGWQKDCLFDLYKDLCCNSIDDKMLFESWSNYVDVMNKQIDAEPQFVHPKTGKIRNRRWSYPDKAFHDKYYSYGKFSKTVIDTLRVKALIHNDRDALTQLEKYYHDKDYELGIAVYYIVMLNFEGNGDLAERIYQLLKKYWVENPGYKRTVYEALNLAALRDNNLRAQQLCDSLGYKLYESGNSEAKFYNHN